MARLRREKSVSGNYHVMLRGINKQDIFFDNQDRIKFLKEMERTKEKWHYSIYSYAIMPNHVHMEIRDNEDCLAKIIHSLSVSYAIYFNKKYDRVGHVFQDRYNSKPVESDEYLLNLMRYIHQNPEKAGIGKIENYKWSSYKNYINREGIADIELILNKISLNKNAQIDEFRKYNFKQVNLKTGKDILEYEIILKLTDDELIYIIKNELNILNIQEIQKFNRKYRDSLLKRLIEIKGTSIEQIARVIGISKKIIERALKGRPVPDATKMSQ